MRSIITHIERQLKQTSLFRKYCEKVPMIERSISKCFLVSHPAVYRIRVPGRMDPKWSGYLQGMTVTVIEEANQETFTELTGLLLDQAALMGVLQQLYNRNIPLLSVECVSSGPKNG